MKKILLFIMLIVSGSTFGQSTEIPWDENGGVTFTEVVQVEGVNAEDLYTRAKLWFTDTYNSSKDVIQMDDKEAGVIIGKGLSKLYIDFKSVQVPANMLYTVKVYLKDGRYKYEITDIRYENEPRAEHGNVITTTYPRDLFQEANYKDKKGRPNDFVLSYESQTLRKTSTLISSLKAAMEKSIGLEAGTGDDW